MERNPPLLITVKTRETESLTIMQCHKCGQRNDAQSHFCRNCGERLMLAQPEHYNNAPPRPYSWKTDEFQTQSEPRPIAREIKQAQYAPMTHSQPMVNSGLRLDYRGPHDLSGGYRCPFCATNFLPVVESRVSTAGWITFGVLLMLTVVFFWIGLLIKENVAICPVCRRQVS